MNANRLKGIACLSMLLDHIGYVLFPQVEWLRWCGRLALPIFAFLVAYSTSINLVSAYAWGFRK